MEIREAVNLSLDTEVGWGRVGSDHYVSQSAENLRENPASHAPPVTIWG
jgi:hypothetical protein